MINRSLDSLVPASRKKFIEFLDAAKKAGIDVLITCTFRTLREQERLYAQGRTTPGKIVTNAKAGYSYHNFGCAIDLVPVRNGKPLWTVFSHGYIMEPEWDKLGIIAKQCGIDWSGTWATYKEYAHFQYTGGLSIAELRAGCEVI